MSKETILTGIRSNDEPTIGNYLGAILPMVDMAKKHAGEYKVNMFVPDLHSFTTPIEHGSLYSQTLRNIKLFIAAGLPVEHEDVNIYRQSYIPAHSELSWILSCFVGFGEAARMVEFKDKSARVGDDRVTVGLFNYPILMAADILLYGAKWVPVGEDQRQHLELARDIAIRFNNKFGETFVVPNDIKSQSSFIDRDSAPRVRSLRNPDKKMSKSINDPAGTILLSDNPEEAAKKVMGATTDSIGKISFDWQQQPGVTNLLQMLALLSGKPQEEINAQWIGKEQYGDLKKAVAQEVSNSLSGLQESLTKLDDNEIQHQLTNSEAEMEKVASHTLTAVQQKVGLRPA
jgi:tryptophanyl-tRNA synthetase